MQGQDEAVGPHSGPAPSALQTVAVRAFPESERGTVAVKLRLPAADALALRAAAQTHRRTVSAQVAWLVATNGAASRARQTEDDLADASEIAAAVAQVPNEIRRLRGDLNRLGGLVKSLFIRPESIGDAERHARECANALSALTEAAEVTKPVVDRTEEGLTLVRSRLEAAAERLAG